MRGEAPSYKVYEDDQVFAFLDINPISEGHTLIIPKRHFENIYDIDNESLQRVITVAKRLAVDYKDKLGAKAVNIAHSSGKEAEQSVFHFHIHLIPRYQNGATPIKFVYDKKLKGKLAETLKKLF